MRHFSRIAFIAASALFGLVDPSAASPILSIEAPSSAALGDAVTVEVGISGITDLYGFQFDVSFNPSVLAAASDVEGSFLPNGGATFFIPGTIDNSGGTVPATADTLLSAISGVSGDGILAVLSFHAIGDGTSPLTISNAILLDSNLNQIDVGLDQGSIRVGGVSTVPEPSSMLLLAAGLPIVIGFRRRVGRPPIQ